MEIITQQQMYGTYSAEVLAKGVDLASLKNPPWDQPSRKLMGLSYQYSRMTVKQLRDPLAALKFLQINRNQWLQKHDTPLPDDNRKAMQIKLDESSKGYVAMLFQNYLKFGSPKDHSQTIEQLKTLQTQAYNHQSSISIQFLLRPKQP